MGGEYSTHGRDEKFIKILVGKPKVKRNIGKPKRRCEYNRRILGK